MPFSGLSVMPLSVFKSLFCLTNRLSALCRNDSSTSKICLYLQVWNCIRIRIGSYNKCCVINVERKTGAHFSNRKKNVYWWNSFSRNMCRHHLPFTHTLLWFDDAHIIWSTSSLGVFVFLYQFVAILFDLCLNVNVFFACSFLNHVRFYYSLCTSL